MCVTRLASGSADDLIAMPTSVLPTSISHALSGSTEKSGASIVMLWNLYIVSSYVLSTRLDEA